MVDAGSAIVNGVGVHEFRLRRDRLSGRRCTTHVFGHGDGDGIDLRRVYA
jgi:hypothetical protein